MRPVSVAFALVTSFACLAVPATAADRVRPLAAEVVQGRLVVHLSDGRRCVSQTPFSEASGAFANCPGLEWRFAAEQRPNILRQIVETGMGLIAAEQLLHPMGLIEVADASGRMTQFISPEPEARR